MADDLYLEITQEDYEQAMAREDHALLFRVLAMDPRPAWFHDHNAQIALAAWLAVHQMLDRAQAIFAAHGEDLEVFRAGYERGYAQGWEHRGKFEQQEKETR